MPRKLPVYENPLVTRLKQKHAQQQDRDYHRNVKRSNPAVAAAKAFYRTQQWQSLRLMQLSAHPLCCDPFNYHIAYGEAKPATQVNHIQRISTHPHLKADMQNLASVCQECHTKVTSMEQQGRIDEVLRLNWRNCD